MITSPGSRVNPAERISTMRPMSYSMSDVFESWRTSPLTRVIKRSCCGFGRSRAGTSTGPSGQPVSIALPRNHWPWFVCTSRAEMSLAMV